MLAVGCWLLQMLSLFDSDLDFKNNRVRLWQPGTVAQLAASEGLLEVPAAVLNESGGWDHVMKQTTTSGCAACTFQMALTAVSIVFFLVAYIQSWPHVFTYLVRLACLLCCAVL